MRTPVDGNLGPDRGGGPATEVGSKTDYETHNLSPCLSSAELLSLPK